MIRNTVKGLLDSREITPYRLWQDTGVSRDTAYRLYNDPDYVPGSDVLDKLCKLYKLQPGDLLRYVPDVQDTPTQTTENNHE